MKYVSSFPEIYFLYLLRNGYEINYDSVSEIILFRLLKL